MAKKIDKTNAARLLDQAGVEYELIPYVVDENNLAAEHIAEQLEEPIEQVFKTLVLCGDKTGHFVCVIPGCCEVDLKKAAKVSGNKKVEMLPLKDLLPTTGYIRGGCSPIGMKKQFPTFVNETSMLFDKIALSGGARGVQVILNPDELIDFIGASYEDLTTD